MSDTQRSPITLSIRIDNVTGLTHEQRGDEDHSIPPKNRVHRGFATIEVEFADDSSGLPGDSVRFLDGVLAAVKEEITDYAMRHAAHRGGHSHLLGD